MDALIILFLVLFVLFMLISGLLPWWMARRARGRDAGGLQKLMGLDNKRHLVYFWSPSCGHCKSMTLVINELMDARDDVHAINLADQAALARELGVMGTPALAVINQGCVEQVQLGARTQSQILKLLNQDE
jgi:thiol-disulfide isomerase/thioredoxin